ncbi:MAG: hypothetical protein LLG37_00400 [Spirochaetia bacterium]|nr:hypothetical protein [Spirochaetia bacterium]
MKRTAVIAAFILLTTSIYAEQYRYEYIYDLNGVTKSAQSTWNSVKEGGYTRITSVSAGVTNTSKTGPDGWTVEWAMKSNDKINGINDIKAVRAGNRIYAHGISMGKEINKDFDIDDRPWCQHIDMQAGAYLNTGKESFEFWLVGAKPEFEAFTMNLKNAGVEVVDVAGTTVEAIKADWRMTGFLSAFWKANYWFRKSDGVSVKFAMPAGDNPKVKGILLK